MTTLSRRAFCVSTLVFCFTLALLNVTDLQMAYASSGKAREHGANLFLTSGCSQCHSIAGVGGDRAPDLDNVGSRRGARQIKRQILKGGHEMPPFRGVLTNDDVKDLVEFLRSCQTTVAPGCLGGMPAKPSQ